MREKQPKPEKSAKRKPSPEQETIRGITLIAIYFLYWIVVMRRDSLHKPGILAAIGLLILTAGFIYGILLVLCGVGNLKEEDNARGGDARTARSVRSKSGSAGASFHTGPSYGGSLSDEDEDGFEEFVDDLCAATGRDPLDAGDRVKALLDPLGKEEE